MKLCNIQFLKAVALTTAFLFLCVSASAVQSKIGFSELKQKSENLLLDKKRLEAIELVDEFLKNSSTKLETEKAKELKMILSKKFLTQEAQNFYEQSLILTLDSKNESKKLIEQCLSLEPVNLDCQIQRLRLEYRENQTTNKAKNSDIKIPTDLQEIDWIKLTFAKKDKDFKNQAILKKVPNGINEVHMIMTILELERSIQSKNYSMAKEALSYLEKNYSDWPEIIFFKQKIDAESSEKQIPNYEKNQNQDTLATYQAKCKSLNKTSVRRYRYDFDLCLRDN